MNKSCQYIFLLIVALLFGTKKIRSMGGDLGSAVKGFKKAMSDEDTSQTAIDHSTQNSSKPNEAA